MTGKRIIVIVLTGLLWLVSALEALAMGTAGWGKFRHFDGWWYWFTQFGFPGWLSPVIGSTEMVLSVLLIVPMVAPYAAVILIGIMIVALFSVVTTPATALGPDGPIVHTVLLVVVMAGWWRRRWRAKEPVLRNPRPRVT